jgi:uncharacterized protein (TIGR00251 family)
VENWPAPVASPGQTAWSAGMKKTSGLRTDLVHVDLRVVPGASRTELAGIKDGCLRVRIAAAPEDGKANRELIAFFSKILGCPKRDLILERGEKSRQKTIGFPLAYKVKFEEILK